MTSSLPSADPSLGILRFDLLDGVSHGISARLGGVSPAPYATLNMGLSTGDSEENVLENRRRFLEALGVSSDAVAMARLRHGKDVTVLRGGTGDGALRCAPLRAGSMWTETVFLSDAVVSDCPSFHVFLTFADCVPIVMADRKRRAVAAAHAGWRGTALGVAPAVVRTMQTVFGSDPRDIVVGIGPSIGPCCYAVGTEVPAAFRANGFLPVMADAAGRTTLDLWASTERQLRDVGVRAGSIENPRICTACHVSSYFSHRAEQGVTGRFALCVGKD